MRRFSRLHQHTCWIFCLAIFAAALTSLPFAAAAGRPPDKAAGQKKEEPLPVKPARKVEFTTSEGTWLSLDVSPDGKTILFELVGDLYTIPFAGGEAKKLTSGMGFNSQPRYSPDGSNPKQLSQDPQSEFLSPAWTADGNYVIASRFTQFPIGAAELWMYHVKGGAGVQITKSHLKPDTRPRQWINAVGASPSKDGRYLYY